MTRKATPEQIKLVKKLIAQVYHTTSVGGCAHIVLDDHNVSDHHIEWCIGWSQGFQYGQQNPEQDRGDVDIQIKCLEELQKLPYWTRKKLVQSKYE